jgi:catechol 2,3-dioxygenase-like lactoylglutathione lyase family enzyme
MLACQRALEEITGYLEVGAPHLGDFRLRVLRGRVSSAVIRPVKLARSAVAGRYGGGVPERRVIIDHMTLGVSNLERSRAFYTRALEPLGFSEIGAWSDQEREIAFGVEGANDFGISQKYESGGQLHVAFAADSEEQVDAFHRAALAAGGTDNGAPGPRPQYSEGYYGAFVLDPDGHNVEAVFHGLLAS